MILIDSKKCSGCGLCIDDCPSKVLQLESNAAFCTKEHCLNCFHCMAICPEKAVSSTDADPSEIVEYNSQEFDINPNVFLNAIKHRRSVRFYKDKKVEQEKIQMLIEAGRFSPTGGNSQNVSYIVVKEGVQKLTELSLKSLYEKTQKQLNESKNVTDRVRLNANRWKKTYFDFKENPDERNKLFFDAKTIVLVVSDSRENGNLAAANMEMMAHFLGLGACHIGFFLYACHSNAEIKEFLGLSQDQNITSCLTVGYPSVRYQRTVSRKKGVVDWR